MFYRFLNDQKNGRPARRRALPWLCDGEYKALAGGKEGLSEAP